jgi:hypothetical protein
MLIVFTLWFYPWIDVLPYHTRNCTVMITNRGRAMVKAERLMESSVFCLDNFLREEWITYYSLLGLGILTFFLKMEHLSPQMHIWVFSLHVLKKQNNGLMKHSPINITKPLLLTICPIWFFKGEGPFQGSWMLQTGYLQKIQSPNTCLSCSKKIHCTEMFHAKQTFFQHWTSN